MNQESISGESPSDTVATFWTGGWDSTFRILDLVVNYGCRVQPVYVVDEYRKSHSNELLATKKVRAMLEQRFPDVSHLLLPTEIVHRKSLVVPEKIAEQFAFLRSVFEIGWQYEWLAAAVEASQFDQIEVAFHSDDNQQIYSFLSQHQVKDTNACGAPSWVLRDWVAKDKYEEGMKLFQHFSYPTLMMGKEEMDRVARESNFADMLEETWFCHYPFGNEPCGACYVCRRYIETGLTRRFPKSALMRNKVWFAVHPLRLLLANPDRFLERVRDKATWLTAKFRKSST